LTQYLGSFPRRTIAVASANVGLGASVTTVLRTSFFANVSAVVGTGVFTGFLRPGSAFDPSGDLAAMQPQMFDQFAAQYNRYKVDKCKIKLKISGLQGAVNAGVWVAAAYPCVDSTAAATYQAAASQQYAKTQSGGFQIFNAVGSGSEGKNMYFDLNHNAVIGSRADAYDSGALVTADPTALQHMVLPIFLQGNTAGVSTWVLEVDMFQTVTFSQKKNVVDA